MRATSRRRLSEALTIAGTAVALFGCAVGPNYVRPPVETPPAYKEAQGWKQAQPQDERPRGAWWEVFNDPQLNTLVSQIAITNESIKAAEARVREARAATEAARAALCPLVTANASATRSGRGGGAAGGGSTGGQGARVSNSYNVGLSA